MNIRLRFLARAACALFVFAASQLAVAQPAALASPDTPDPLLVWDLTRLFPDDAAWDAERAAVTAEIPGLAALRGTLGRDAASLRTALDRMSALRLRMSRLWVYVCTQLSTDNGNRRNQERSVSMSALSAH